MEDIILVVLTALTAAIVGGLVAGWGMLGSFVKKTETKLDDKALEILAKAMKEISK